MAQAFDFKNVFANNLPAPAGPYGGLAKFHFVGGNNDPEGVPVEGLAESAQRVIRQYGSDLAVYYPNGGPLGDQGLREFLSGKLQKSRGFKPAPENILVTSGSNHALDLLCMTMISPGDVVISEEHSYANMLQRLRNHNAKVIPVKLDGDGLCCEHLAEILEAQKQIGVTPKFIYAMPTVQNPTATVMSVERRRKLLDLSRQYGVVLIEDECYADLLWDDKAPDSLCAMPGAEHVIHIGSFSKFLAPALRLGYVSAPQEVLMQMVAVKSDSGTCALSQMIVADYLREHYDQHLVALNKRLKAKKDVLISALREHFGDAAEFDDPPGGIFLWVRLPEQVNTSQLAPVALAEGLAFNPGAEWSVEGVPATRYLRLCFAHPSAQQLRDGVALLAQLCEREFGVSAKIAA